MRNNDIIWMQYIAYRLRRDNVALFVSVEACDALESHVIGFGCTGCKYDILGLRTDEVGKMLYVYVSRYN